MTQDPVADASLKHENHEARAKLQDAVEATAVVAAVSEADGSAQAPQQKSVNIAFPPQEAAQDDTLVTHITEFVNRIYYDSEASFWNPDSARTNTAEIRDYLRSGALALAWRPDCSYESHSDVAAELWGCIYIKLLPAEQTGEFGMLACEPKARGRGVGRDLLRFAEEDLKRRGAEQMRLELLQGDGWRHDFKDRLEAWYERAGYQLVAVEEVRKRWAALVPMLAKPAVMKVFHKKLL
jgi:GNAT superfamily N-acetyltransferase